MARETEYSRVVPETRGGAGGLLSACEGAEVRGAVGAGLGEEVWEDAGAGVGEVEFAEGGWGDGNRGREKLILSLGVCAATKIGDAFEDRGKR